MRFLLLLVICLSVFPPHSFAAINFWVTPIKYELTLAPWESITLPMSIRNNGTGTVTMPTATSDFTSSWLGWTPKFVRKSELVFPDQQLSTWITIDDSSLTASAWEEVTTNFTIDVPTTATPGWHYGAVFFKRESWALSTSWNIWIDVDYGIIILLNVSWSIIIGAVIDDPIIGSSSNVFYDRCEWNDTSGSIYDGSCGEWIPALIEEKDVCLLWDFTPSKYDGKCFWPTDSTDQADSNWSVINTWDFNIDFSFPINNTGNTHIKPTGKIVLKDENWDIIKAIWKETLSNDSWAVTWVNIVDYIPINDQDGNILPYSKRVFESQWKWFPYKTYDIEGNQVVNYWTPSEYYTQKNKQEAWFLMLWERVSETRQHKTITAEIEIIYYDEDGNPVEFTSAQEFPIQYIEQKVTVNPYVILSLLLLFTAWLFTWFGLRWWILWFKKSICWNCEEGIKSHWETCPHCSAIQNKKKHKAYEQQREKEVVKKTNTKRKTPAKKTATKKTATKKAPVKKKAAKKSTTKK